MIKVKRFNSACEKAGGQLLKQALQDKADRKVASGKDVAQGAKEIAHDLGFKHRGTIIFAPTEAYSRGYDQINWG